MESPVTKAYFYEINQRLKSYHLELGSGRTLDKSNLQSTALQTAEIVAKIEELQELLDIDLIKE